MYYLRYIAFLLSLWVPCHAFHTTHSRIRKIEIVDVPIEALIDSLSKANGRIYFKMPILRRIDDLDKLDRQTIERRLGEKSPRKSKHFISLKTLATILENPTANARVLNTRYNDAQVLHATTIAMYLKRSTRLIKLKIGTDWVAFPPENFADYILSEAKSSGINYRKLKHCAS